MKNKLGVALVKELCPICTKEVESSIVMNTKLTEANAKKVEAMHNGNTWSKTLCTECADMKSKGFILIGAVEKKTGDTTNPYRSGNIWVVKQEVAETLFAPHGAPKSGVAFIDVTVAQEMELPNVNINA
jgi:type II secretory ATPase GspE/PulE/Tfp pilus assembly ATPase PilB-like protein